MKTSDFWYDLPEELIAQTPVEPRDSSRLFVLPREGAFEHRHFSDLPEYLRPGDALVIIDADLQDPPELIPQMAEKWKQGVQVVYAQRNKRAGETAFKKWTASAY